MFFVLDLIKLSHLLLIFYCKILVLAFGMIATETMLFIHLLRSCKCLQNLYFFILVLCGFVSIITLEVTIRKLTFYFIYIFKK